MTDIRRAAQRYRGGEPGAGITTLHSFSFGAHYDPDNLRFGALIASNEEHLDPGAGFEEHPHRDTEIVTWVVEGELTHRDSTGHATVVRPGDVQRLNAASGVRHVERNDGTAPLVFVQMWLAPLAAGGSPAYDVVRALGDGVPFPLPGAGAVLRVHRLAPGARAEAPAAPWVHLQVVRGTARLLGEDLATGDAARLTGPAGPLVLAGGAEGAEVLTVSAAP
ncbi:pirin family protein [Streptomyces sp. NPDC057638]|uniref:pirin family protein n=1 Tax=Streptomyces sp. NPDC057638 TaxID=3346190 RepID=UPI0036C54BBD